MKQYQLQIDFMGMPKGTILEGPLPIKGQSNLGYYTQENISSAPSTNCIFQSAVENNPGIFKEIVNSQP